MKKKIAVADDNEIYLTYIGLQLKEMGFEVIHAENATKLLTILKTQKPDVVMLDIQLPIMDGYTVLRLIKEDKKTFKIPVIMISSDSSMKTIKKCKSLGCYDFLAKPVEMDKLNKVLQKCFSSHKSTGKKK
jgi:CheY-like chemotaxis protein